MECLEFDNWNARKEGEHLSACWSFSSIAQEFFCEGSRIGYCGLCKKRTEFVLATGGNWREANLREQLICCGCGLNARLRAGIALSQSAIEGRTDSQMYVTEQATATFVWMQKNIRANVTGSEFASSEPDLTRLSRYLSQIGGQGDVQFNDVTASKFEDEAFDAILSCDVLEHVPDYAKALSEFARTLRSGGSLVATFPFLDVPATLTRARVTKSGEVEHLLEPEYHGDPLGEGVLCWYHFGWDILESCRMAGFSSAKMVLPWAPEQGLFYGLWTLVAKR